MPEAKSPAKRVTTYKVIQSIIGIVFIVYII